MERRITKPVLVNIEGLFLGYKVCDALCIARSLDTEKARLLDVYWALRKEALSLTLSYTCRITIQPKNVSS